MAYYAPVEYGTFTFYINKMSALRSVRSVPTRALNSSDAFSVLVDMPGTLLTVVTVRRECSGTRRAMHSRESKLARCSVRSQCYFKRRQHVIQHNSSTPLLRL